VNDHWFYRNFHPAGSKETGSSSALKHRPTDRPRAMNEDFDIIVGSEIRTISRRRRLEDNDNVALPRIGFGFNRRDYGTAETAH
jgi:hypothetical protein